MRLLTWVWVIMVACGPSPRSNPGDDDGGNTIDAHDPNCPLSCSADLHSVVDCNNTIVTTCAGTDACDGASHACVDACTGAATNHHSIGCDYYATDTETEQPTYCFAAFVANTWTSPAHISVDGRLVCRVAAMTFSGRGITLHELFEDTVA